MEPFAQLAILVFAFSGVFVTGHAWTWERGAGNAVFTWFTAGLAGLGVVCLLAQVVVTGGHDQALLWLICYALTATLLWALTVMLRIGWDALLRLSYRR